MYVCVVTILISMNFVVWNGNMCGEFGLGLPGVCEGGGYLIFIRVSVILLEKMVWSSFRWLLAACSTWM